MKKILPAILCLTVLVSCASLNVVSEEFRPLHMRLLSSDDKIWAAAKSEFSGLKDGEKKDIVLSLVELFGREEDPLKRLKILAILSETGAGAYAAAPMIKAAAANGSIRDFKEITAYLRSLPLSGEDALKLKEMLKEGAWKTRSLALDALSGMSKKAEKAVPEIIALMKSSAEAEKYEKAFDSLAMINPEIAFTALVSDLKNPDSAIRKNAMNKLVEMQAYLSDKLGVKKEIVPALIRVLYGADEALSRLAQDALSRIEDPDARQAMENYIKIGKRAMELFYGLAGKTAQEVFKLQEQAVEKKLNNYYRQIGREDAAGK